MIPRRARRAGARYGWRRGRPRPVAPSEGGAPAGPAAVAPPCGQRATSLASVPTRTAATAAASTRSARVERSAPASRSALARAVRRARRARLEGRVELVGVEVLEHVAVVRHLRRRPCGLLLAKHHVEKNQQVVDKMAE